jgi:hypothetical protein
MTNHPSVPTAAQCGEHRIAVSVKTLASFFARNSLAKTPAKTLSEVPMIDSKGHEPFTVQRILSFVTAIPTLVCEICDTEQNYGSRNLCLIVQNEKRKKVRNRPKKFRFRQSRSKRLAR